MTFVETLAKSTADAGRELLRRAGVPQDKPGQMTTGLIPICPLHPEHMGCDQKAHVEFVGARPLSAIWLCREG